MPLVSNSQDWTPLDTGTNSAVRIIFIDSTSEDLFFRGNFTKASGLKVNYITRWDGASWDSLGRGSHVGANNSFCEPVLAIIRFNNLLIAEGQFSSTYNIGTWDGNSWDFLAVSNGSIVRFRIIDSELFAVGNFDSIGEVGAKAPTIKPDH
ncbi:MAG: hypothetical protein IH946_11945 [Bacteroidetes bacterium]|nr:hypothetical protein [Bacteroidota bacterium]